MKRFAARLSMLLCLPFLFACYAGPSPSDHPWSVQGFGSFQNTDSSEIDESFGGGAAGSVHVGDYVALEVGANQSQTDYDLVDDGQSRDVDVNETTAHALVKVNFTKDTPLRPYAGAGPSYMFFSSTDKSDQTSLSDVDFENELGWMGVLGAETHLGKPEPLADEWRHWYIFAEVRRMWMDLETDDVTSPDPSNGVDDRDAWFFIFGIKRRF